MDPDEDSGLKDEQVEKKRRRLKKSDMVEEEAQMA